MVETMLTTVDLGKACTPQDLQPFTPPASHTHRTLKAKQS